MAFLVYPEDFEILEIDATVCTESLLMMIKQMPRMHPEGQIVDITVLTRVSVPFAFPLRLFYLV